MINNSSTAIDESSVGLYGNSRLAAINNVNGPKFDIIRKDIITLFKEEWLPITIETNIIKTDFIDITFNLVTEKYFSFQNANNKPPHYNHQNFRFILQQGGVWENQICL